MQLLHSLWQLIRTWREQDRICAAPAPGRLLPLMPGMRLMIQQRLYAIEQRQVTTADSATQSQYTLRDMDEASATMAQLTISVATAFPAGGTILFQRDSTTMELDINEVTILVEPH